jgi:nitrogen-specific signal transduction histidine kinase
MPRDSDFTAHVLESMSSGVVTIDAAGRLVSANAAARLILGLSDADAARGASCRQVFRSHPALAHLLAVGLERAGPISRAELVLEQAGGGPACTLGFTLCPVRDPQGRLRGAALIFRDLAPIERRDEQQQLRERLAALGQVAAGLAHEIRNPLAGMQVVAGLLRRRLADRPEEQALVAELIGELRVVADTVTASLEFVRPVEPLYTAVDPVGALEDALDAARKRVGFEGSIERAFEDGVPALRADPEQLRTLLTNLIANAFEAMAEGGTQRPRLRLALRGHRGRELEITVADSGPGVPPGLREKIFYPFFTTRRRGSGVGLAAVQKIAASHGGSLELESREGEGASFRVRLPLEGPELR